MSFFRQAIGFLQARKEYTEKTQPTDEGIPYSTVPLDSVCRSWQTNLIRIAQELTGISRGTEDEFLALGEGLNALSDACDKNSSMASSLINMVESSNGFNIGTFEDLFGKAYGNTGSSADAISTGLSDMTCLKDSLEEISDLRLFLNDLSRSIAIIGILTRIETARLDAVDFNSMTAVVDELALQIAKSTNEIAVSANAANKQIATVSGKIGTDLETFKKELDIAMEGVRNILDEMNDMKKKAAWTCKRIEGRSSQIIPEIGEIIVALQYHDICRQQMEHVDKALRDVAEKIKAISKAIENEKESLKKWIADAIKIQISQLENVIAETTSAAEKISEHLTRISDLSEAQTEDAIMIVEEEESGSFRIKKIVDKLESLLSITSRCKSMTTEMIKAVSDVNNRIGTMSGHVSNIVLISDNISLLALNAIIKVARTGESGKALEVLADKIKSLSQQAREEIEKGAEKINSILAGSAEARDTLSDILKEQLISADKISEESRSAAKELIVADKSLIDFLTEISNITNNIKSDVARLVEGIRFDDAVKSGVGSIISKLVSMLSELDKPITAEDRDKPAAIATELKDLTQRYTMSIEREVHESALTSRTTVPNAFGIIPAKKVISESDKVEGELGGNIELF